MDKSVRQSRRNAEGEFLELASLSVKHNSLILQFHHLAWSSQLDDRPMLEIVFNFLLPLLYGVDCTLLGLGCRLLGGLLTFLSYFVLVVKSIRISEVIFGHYFPFLGNLVVRVTEFEAGKLPLLQHRDYPFPEFFLSLHNNKCKKNSVSGLLYRGVDTL